MVKKIILVSVSIIIGFILVECYFIFYNPQNLNATSRLYAKNGLLLNTKDKKISHYLNGKKKLDYSFGEFHNREYGFNRTKETVLALGDSFTFGWHLDDEDTFIYKLNEKIPKYKFINAAAGGWGTSDQLSYFMLFCEQIKPKYTIIFINFSDLGRSVISKLFKMDHNENLVEGKNKIIRTKKILEQSIIYNYLVANIHTVAFVKTFYLDTKTINQINSVPVNFEFKKNFIFAKKLFLKFKDEAKKCGTEIFFINLGWENYNEVDSDGMTSVFLLQNKSFLSKNFNYIDLNSDLKIIQKNKKKFSLPGDDHPNKLGSQFLFDTIYKRIVMLIN